jgi:hypothetical protein
MQSIPLSYSTPKIFFQGVRKYRGPEIFVGIALCLTFSVGFGFVAFLAPPGPRNFTSFEFGIAALFGAGSLAFAWMIVFALYSWATKSEVFVRITEDGIEHGRKFWPWERIAAISGEYFTWPEGVTLIMRPRGTVCRERYLSVNRRLSEPEFVELMNRLKEYLSARYPQVRVELELRYPST